MYINQKSHPFIENIKMMSKWRAKKKIMEENFCIHSVSLLLLNKDDMHFHQKYQVMGDQFSKIKMGGVVDYSLS